jgi:hypothetical protein
MVHVQYTSVASGAVMASLGLKYVAHQAIPPSFILRVTEVEAPEDRNLSRISEHRLEEWPNKQDKYHVEENK